MRRTPAKGTAQETDQLRLIYFVNPHLSTNLLRTGPEHSSSPPSLLCAFEHGKLTVAELEKPKHVSLDGLRRPSTVNSVVLPGCSAASAMPGILRPISQQPEWNQHRFDVMTGRKSKKQRRKMPTIAMLCSCMHGQPQTPDDFPQSCRPYDRKPPKAASREPAETSPTESVAAAANSKVALEVTSEEPEPAQDIEMPPPMAIQGHSFKASPEAPAAPPTVDGTVSKLATLTLKAQTEVATSSLDLANEIESIVKQRIETTDSKPESSTEEEAGASEEQGGGAGEEKKEEEAAAAAAAGEEEQQQQQKAEEEEEDKAKEEEEKKEEEEEEEQPAEKDEAAEKEKILKKRQYVVHELYETEKAYVEDLRSLVDGYMGYMKENPMPEGLVGKDKIVFGNIHQIYDWHKETMEKELESCLVTPDKVGSIFIRYERRLYMYVKYCENKPKSEYIVSEFLDTYFEEIRQKLGHRLTLPDLLIKPVQRIMRYQLLLKDILKYTEKAGIDPTQMNKALRVMCVVPKAANDMMQVGRLQGFNGKITAQGKLLLQDTLSVSEITAGMPQKAKERRLFLFEQLIIFSEMIGRAGDFASARYVYKNSVKVNKMALTKEVEGEPLKFILIDRTPGADTKYVVQTPSEEVKETWMREIDSILDMQGNFLRALQSPIAYQKELGKDPFSMPGKS